MVEHIQKLIEKLAQLVFPLKAVPVPVRVKANKRHP